MKIKILSKPNLTIDWDFVIKDGFLYVFFETADDRVKQIKVGAIKNNYVNDIIDNYAINTITLKYE